MAKMFGPEIPERCSTEMPRFDLKCNPTSRIIEICKTGKARLVPVGILWQRKDAMCAQVLLSQDFARVSNCLRSAGCDFTLTPSHSSCRIREAINDRLGERAVRTD